MEKHSLNIPKKNIHKCRLSDTQQQTFEIQKKKEIIGKQRGGGDGSRGMESDNQKQKVNMEVKINLNDSVLVFPVMYGSETRTILEGQKSWPRAMEMEYLRTACGGTRWTNERVL